MTSLIAVDANSWASEEFGHATLGDVRRTRRLVKVATGAALTPAGKISQVYTTKREREGAYDLLESGYVTSKAVSQAMYGATVARVKGLAEPFVYVVVDGTSINITDTKNVKGFGRLGPSDRRACGLQVMNALCIASDGTPLGLLDQQFWARPPPALPNESRLNRERRMRQTPFEKKESYRFVSSALAAIERLAKIGVRAWIIIDREGDNQEILRRLAQTNCFMTIRGTGNRKLVGEGYLKARLAVEAQPIMGRYAVHVTRHGARKSRMASMAIRVVQVPLKLQQKTSTTRLPMHMVWVRESDESSSLANALPLDWLLYTNVDTKTSDDALHIVQSYVHRWKIEEFHRTWKTGACNIEHTQLRTLNAVTTWATILAANAVRIERIKHLARTQPEAPATLILRPIELQTLIQLRKESSPYPHEGPVTISVVTVWIAELGGWVAGKNKKPGSITIHRGLQTLVHITHGFELALISR